MTCAVQCEAPPAANGIEIDHHTREFPHEEVRKANKFYKVFTMRDEIELCADFHEGVRQGEDREALKTQITAYINYMEATCNHAHFTTDFLRNMVRDRVLPEDVDLDDIEDDSEDEINEPISCMHVHLEATPANAGAVGGLGGLGGVVRANSRCSKSI